MKTRLWFLTAALLIATASTTYAGAKDGQSDADPCNLDPWCADADEDGVPDAADPCPTDPDDLCTLPPVG
ncbi:MAG: hypothetical protein AMXMBFR64_19060 [Myxococcales bacterium]